MKQKIENERFLLLQQQIPFISLGNLLAGLGLISMLWDVIPAPILLLWYGLLVLFWGGRGLYSYLQNKQIHDAQAIERQRRFYYIFPVISGIFWGGAGVLFFIPESATHMVYLLMFQFGLIAGGAVSLAYLRWAFPLFAFITVIPIAILLLLENNWYYFWMAITSVFSMLIMFGLSHNVYASITDSLLIRFENEALVKKLQQQAQELNKQREKAIKANKDKSRFLASASHDLRQPIHSLSLLTDALEPQVESKTGKSILKLIRSANGSLYSLLSSLLDISKLDAGVIEPSIERIALAPLLRQLVDRYRVVAENQGLQLRFRVCDCYVDSDPTLLSSAVMNLLDNAIKYTPRGGVVLVAMRLYQQHVKIQIWDTGIGIETCYQEKIYDEFLQLANPERDKEKGLGLGLSISKRLLQLLDYPLLLRSIVNKGSVFSITLPLSILPDNAILNKHETATLYNASNDKECTVLVIDDNTTVCEATSAVLKSWGCEVVIASCLEEVGTIAKSVNANKIDVIIADYRLRENTTGIEAIKVFEKLSGSIDIPAFLLTGDTDPLRIQEAGSFGLPLLHKPLQQGELKRVLRSLD